MPWTGVQVSKKPISESKSASVATARCAKRGYTLRVTRFHTVLGMGLGTLLAVGCSSSKCDAPSPCTEPPAQVWVGSVDGTDAAIGVADTGAGSTVFVCGGNDSFETFTHWFSSDQAVQGSFEITDGDWSIRWSLELRGIVGSITSPSDPEPHAFSAQPANTGAAGVYQGNADCGRAGLIIQQANGEEEPSAQGTCLKREDARVLIEQVNPVRPIKLNPNLSVLVELGSDPGRTFTLDPLVPSSAK